MKSTLSFFLALLLLAACVPPQAPPRAAPTGLVPTVEEESTPLPTAKAGEIPAQCDLPVVVAPTLPAVIPAYTELDENTGLHMTGIAQVIDVEAYRLEVSGRVDFPLSLTYAELRCLPKMTDEPALICPGFFEDVAEWAGVPLGYVLDLAGVQAGAKSIILFGADGYQTSLSMENARRPDIFLAYEWEGEPLPVLHGFPLRVVAPGLAGSNWVKWLVKIVVE